MKKLLILSAAALLFAAAPAKADQFDYGSFSVFQGQNITITSPTGVTADTGLILLQGAGAQSGITLDAWCVDLFHELAGSSIYNIVPLTTAGSGAPNPMLTAAQINQMGTLMVRGDADTPGDVFGANTSAAFQLAIWSVEYGGTLLDNANGPLAMLVTQLDINAAPGGIWFDPNSTVELLDAPASNQVLGIGTTAVAVPAPIVGAGLPGMIGALAVMFGLHRRRRQQLA
jgi:hypothetical protein